MSFPYPDSGRPNFKPDPARKAALQRKLDKKVGELQESRKKNKPEEASGEKNSKRWYYDGDVVEQCSKISEISASHNDYLVLISTFLKILLNGGDHVGGPAAAYWRNL